MRITATSLPGLMLIEPDPVADERGFFARVFDSKLFEEAGIDFVTHDVNLSRNTACHTLRGLHFQNPPFGEAKIVRVTRGRIFDVAVDLRPGPTFGRWFGTELDEKNAVALYVPVGFAHGFLTLESYSDVLYQMGSPYLPAHAETIAWNDPDIGIDWPAHPLVMSDKDRNAPQLGKCKRRP